MKVLVADDDLVSQRILKSYLEKWGYEFVLVGDGAQAWELLQEQDISIVLTD
jgi:CheY-like chemotaxis protein